MAWQLIYTSAPRSLEAGRSGFGTVARHRAITPLLASAVERISQFSRLPGTDADRVIFCHRIIAVGGGRFHVLSMIRDAGADYTGRTNHIAHHLIAEPREIAQLGAGGMSPADVMLAMNWAKSWNEPPRHFEATEEVDLSAMHPQTTDSAWQWVAGSAEHAWLLAVGDASRGAYVISPGGTDLRAIFGESLRLMPERLWQISFTTSLQPSDEPADFRWIGIEEQSPLRSQSAASGRPVLDLSAPKTLPLPEVPQFSPAVQLIKEPEPEISVSTSEKSPSGTDLRLPSIKIRVGTAPTYSYNKPKSAGRVHQQTKPTSSSLLWLYVAGFLLLAIGFGVFFVGWPAYQNYQESQRRETVRAEIDFILNVCKDALPDVPEELKAIVPTNSAIAKELALSTKSSWEAASKKNFDNMRDLTKKHQGLSERAKREGVTIPSKITVFEKLLSDIVTIKDELSTLKPKEAKDFADLNKLESSIKNQREKLTDFKQTLEVLSGNIRAKTAQSLFERREKLDSLKNEINDKYFSIQDEETKKIREQVENWINDWEFVNAQQPTKVLTELEERIKQRSDWPPWLKEEAEKKVATARNGQKKDGGFNQPPPEQKPPPIKPTSTPPEIYLFADNDDLNFPLPSGDELWMNLPSNPPSKLETTKDTARFGPNGEYFKREKDIIKKADKPPAPPYRLTIKRRDVVVAYIFVDKPQSEDSLLESLVTELKLKSNGEIVGKLPKLAPEKEVFFKLETPGGIDGTKNKHQLNLNEKEKDKFDLKPAIESLKKEIQKRADEIAGINKKLNPEKQSQPVRNTPKTVGENAVNFVKRYDQKDMLNPFEKLRELGKKLTELPVDEVDAAKKVNNDLKVSVEQYRKSPNDNKRGDIQKELGSLSGDCFSLDSDLKEKLTNKKNLEPQIEKKARLTEEWDSLRKLPLLQDGGALPSGEYTLCIKRINILEPIKLRTFMIPPIPKN